MTTKIKRTCIARETDSLPVDDYVAKHITDGEEVIIVVRRHPILLVGPAIRALFFAVLAVGLLIVSSMVGLADFPILDKLPITPVLFGLAALLVLVGAGPLVGAWIRIRYAEDIVLTSNRLLKVDGIIHKRVDATLLDKINDSKFDQGIIERMTDTGTVQIFTASDQADTSIRYLRHATRFQMLLEQARVDYRSSGYDRALSRHDRDDRDDRRQQSDRQVRRWDDDET